MVEVVVIGPDLRAQVAVEHARLPTDLVVGDVFLAERRRDGLLREGVERGVQTARLRAGGDKGIEEVVGVQRPVEGDFPGQIVAAERLVLELVKEGRELGHIEQDVVVGRAPFRVAQAALQLEPVGEIEAHLTEGGEGMGVIRPHEILVKPARRDADVEVRKIVPVVLVVAAQDPGERAGVRRDQIELLGKGPLVQRLVDDEVGGRQVRAVDVAVPAAMALLEAAHRSEGDVARKGVVHPQHRPNELVDGGGLIVVGEVEQTGGRIHLAC